ncbi:MAG: epoxyqueuosine reductase [Oscillospiraceae bacterium]|nr:epoxyqueuosine reductase [Oscillospiraceae bacterium]
MTVGKLFDNVSKFLRTHPMSVVLEEDALRPDLAGMRMFDDPIFAIGDANDPLFKELKSPGVVSEELILPGEWLPVAKSVISFFLPFTDEVKRSNCDMSSSASDEWLHARIEGQMILDIFADYIKSELEKAGFEAIVPALDPRFKTIEPFTSNWSERHAAYICGLGTFGLSKGLITKKGMTGRFGSVITNAELPVTEREYSSPFEYCNMCGKCAKNCPVGAIDPSKGVACGKSHEICATIVRQKLPPHGKNQRIRYGCGKCQVAVPCESCIPKKV